jgi:hypothetical protein
MRGYHPTPHKQNVEHNSYRNQKNTLVLPGVSQSEARKRHRGAGVEKECIVKTPVSQRGARLRHLGSFREQSIDLKET